MRSEGNGIKSINSIGCDFADIFGEESRESSFDIEWQQYIEIVKNYHPENPLDFQKIYRDGTVFSEIERKILAILAYSAIVERLFSYAGINEGKLRTYMAPDNRSLYNSL